MEPSEIERAHYARLFNDVLQHMREQFEVDIDDLEEGIDNVINSFRYKEGNDYFNVKYSVPKNACGFFYRFSQLAAELVEGRVTQAICLADLFRYDLRGDEINVVILGCGGGADIVGLCSALYQVKGLNCVKLNIKLVDKERMWCDFVRVLMRYLGEGDYGMASKLIQKCEVSTRYICWDAGDTRSLNYLNALQNADIILMQRLMSILPFEEKPKVARNIARNMKDAAVLLYIDTPYDFRPFGLEEDYNTQDDVQEDYSVGGSPMRNYGRGIALASKAHLSVLKKRTQHLYNRSSPSP